MRDLVLLGLFPILVYYAIRKPFIGLSLWLWTSLVPMQTWAYGLSTSLRWNLIFALSTIIGYIFMKDKPKVKINGILVGMIFLLLVATLSAIFNEGFGPHVWDRWERFLKATIFFVFVMLIVDKKIHVEALMWACVLSITATAAKQGIKVFVSGGTHVVYGMSTTFDDNNLSAFATLLCIPFTLYLISLYKNQLIIKWGLIGAVGVSVIFVLGSDSRGGLLGLLVLAGYYFVKSDRKVPIAIAFVFVGAIGLSLMDASWFERMDTINNASEDGSFMGRVIAWKLSILMALNSPFFGGGFDAIAYKPTWTLLLSDWNTVNFISSPYPTTGHVAHSIYFQVLGDLGFLGFFIYSYILLGSYRRFSIANVRKNEEDNWRQDVSLFIRLSLICVFVSGAALSAAYNEIVFMIAGLAAGLQSVSSKS